MTDDYYRHFNEKADDYAESWPNYGKAYVSLIKDLAEKNNYQSAIDIACGTGLHTKAIAPIFKSIVASEPNDDMRDRCRRDLAAFKNISFNSDCAENIRSDIKFDIIFVAQAFTLLNRDKIKISFKSILNDGGRVVLVWNNKTDYILFKEIRTLSEKFCSLYADNESYRFDYGRHSLDDFFIKPPVFYKIHNDAENMISEDTFLKRCLSTSYAPSKDQPNYQGYFQGLKNLFKKYSDNYATIFYPLDTTVYIGEL